jgi:hypothetical protein
METAFESGTFADADPPALNELLKFPHTKAFTFL